MLRVLERLMAMRTLKSNPRRYFIECTMEKLLHHKQYAMATFLDIEGAFNNIEISTIIDSLSHGLRMDKIAAYEQNDYMLASNRSETHSSYVS